MSRVQILFCCQLLMWISTKRQRSTYTLSWKWVIIICSNFSGTLSHSHLFFLGLFLTRSWCFDIDRHLCIFFFCDSVTTFGSASTCVSYTFLGSISSSSSWKLSACSCNFLNYVLACLVVLLISRLVILLISSVHYWMSVIILWNHFNCVNCWFI